MKKPYVKVIDVGTWGCWLFSKENNQITFWNGRGILREFEWHPLIQTNWNWEIFTSFLHGFTLVCASYDNTIYCLDAQGFTVRELARLNRHPDDDMGFCSGYFESHEDIVLFIYERGVVCIDLTAQVKWRQDDLKIDFHYKGVQNGFVIYEHEVVGCWGYDLQNGDKRVILR